VAIQGAAALLELIPRTCAGTSDPPAEYKRARGAVMLRDCSDVKFFDASAVHEFSIILNAALNCFLYENPQISHSIPHCVLSKVDSCEN